ncbi:unnamed protein product [Natator depressus]
MPTLNQNKDQCVVCIPRQKWNRGGPVAVGKGDFLGNVKKTNPSPSEECSNLPCLKEKSICLAHSGNLRVPKASVEGMKL